MDTADLLKLKFCTVRPEVYEDVCIVCVWCTRYQYFIIQASYEDHLQSAHGSPYVECTQLMKELKKSVFMQ